MKEAQVLEVPTAGCPDWTRFNEYRSGHLTVTELCVLAEMIGDDDTVRQVLRGERIIKVVLKNPTHGKVLGDLLEEVGDLVEAPAVPSFFAREKFIVGCGELDIASISGDVDILQTIVEIDIHANVLRRRKVLKRALDVLTLAVLGRASIAASHLYWLLQTEPRQSFHCFVKASGALLSINVWWDNGRHLEVLRVPYPREFERGDLLITP